MRNKHKTKFMRTVMLLLACVLNFATVWAETDVDYKYSINSDGVTVTITIYNGSGGDLTIPETLGGKPVTAIDGNAFNNEYGKKVTTLTIPATVTDIGYAAFANCSSLKSVTFNGGTTPITIGNAAFGFCSSLESVTFKGSVGAINILAFSSCPSLKSVTFEGEVGSVGENTFLYCTSLKSIFMLSETGTAPDLRNAGIPQGCTIYVHGNQYNYTNQKHLYTITPGTNVTVCSTPIVTSSNGTNYYAEGAKVRLDYAGKFDTTGYGPAYKATKTVGGTDVTADVIRESVIYMPNYDVTVTASGVDVWGVDKGADGSQQKPYVITSTIGLDLLAKNVNGAGGYTPNDFSGKYFVLDADIEYLHETAWDDANSTENNYTAIGGRSKQFEGNFNGQGHVVRGIRIHNSADTDYNGLFGGIKKKASVSHVVLKDARIWGSAYIGGIVGSGNIQVTITDCHVTEDVCISINDNDNSAFIGSIAGEINSSSIVSGCTSKAKIIDSQGKGSYIGGIVGFSGGSTIKDCIYLSSKIIGGNSHVGAIVGSINSGKVINCYYTDSSITGKDYNGNDVTLSNGNPAIGYNFNGATYTNTGLAHTITLGDGVALSGTATGYGVEYEAFRLTSYATNEVGHALKLEIENLPGLPVRTTYYSTKDAEVGLKYTGTAPEGTTHDGFKATQTGSNDEALSSDIESTLTMPNYDVTVSPNFYKTNVPYLTWDDNKKELVSTTTPTGTKVWMIPSSNGNIKYDGGWYFVSGDVTINGNLTFIDETHLILCDGAKMTLTGEVSNSQSPFTIYSQSTGENTGKLSANQIYIRDLTINGGQVTATNSGDDSKGIHSWNNLTINGGQVTATASGDRSVGILSGGEILTINGGQVTANGGYKGISAENGNVTINGGQVTATGSTYGIQAGSGNIILGWTHADDYIKASSYQIHFSRNYVKTADGKRFVAYTPGATANDPETASGIISGTISDLTTINGKTLRPINGYLVGIKDDSNRITLKDGTTGLTPDFTQNNIPYYICEASEKYYLGCDAIGYAVTNTATKISDNSDVTTSVLDGNKITMPDYDVYVTPAFTDVWDIAGGAVGSEEKPYVITTTTGLDLLAKNVNGSDGYTANNFSGKYFVLDADIEYSHKTAWDDDTSEENNYTPIGGNNKRFEGNFNGQGHVVRGIRIHNSADTDYNGLFGGIKNKASVSHVVLKDARIWGAAHIGGIVGAGDIQVTITDCHVTEDVCISINVPNDNNFRNYIGSIAGDINSSSIVSGCTSKAKIIDPQGEGSYIGGIVGASSYITIKDCIYLGSKIIGGNSSVGAIVGLILHGKVINCYYTDSSIKGKDRNGNDVTLSNNGNPAIGYNNGATVTNTGLAYAITLGDGVALSGTATGYALDGEAIRLTSYATNDVGYALKLETVSGNNTATTYYSMQGTTVPFGYTGTTPTGTTLGYIVKDADGALVSETSPFTMPAKDVTVSAGFYTTKVPYIAIDGTSTTTPDGVKVWVLDGKETTFGISGADTNNKPYETWYFSNTAATANNGNGLSYNNEIFLYGAVNLILADNSKMTVTDNTDGACAIRSSVGTNTTLAIYGQTAGNGKLTATGNIEGIFAHNGITINEVEVEATGVFAYGILSNGDITIRNSHITAEGSSSGIVGNNITFTGSEVESTGTNTMGIEAKNSVTINSGKITAKGNIMGLSAAYDITINGGEVNAKGNNVFGINSSQSSVTINGGQITAKGNSSDIVGPGDITLGWTNADDFIKADKYLSNVVKVANGEIFQYTDGSTEVKLYEGDITAFATGGTINNLKLTPYGYGGYCGKDNDIKNVTWEIPFGSDGKLSTEMTVDGRGDMADYDSDGAPWKRHSFTIANIEYDVTSIGKNAFTGCQDLNAILVSEVSEMDYKSALDDENQWKNKIYAKELTLFATGATNEWMTLCDATARTLPNGCTAYEVKSIAGGTVTLSQMENQKVPAYTPVLIKRNAETQLPNDGYKATYGGTETNSYSNVSNQDGYCWSVVETGNKFLGNLCTKSASIENVINSDNDFSYFSLYGDKFYRIEGDPGINAHRCVLAANKESLVAGGSGIRELRIITDNVDGIDVNVNVNVNPNPNDDVWYDLSGRKVANGQKPTVNGLYINKNGKKIVMKK